MKTICFIVPFFGKLPSYFDTWLHSCRLNSTISFIIITDDHSQYNYPNNVKVKYYLFSDIQKLIQANYSFPVSINNAYKLCDYKIAYGEIFKKELEGYDFWGFCDIDIIWGDIRSFYTDELLAMYDKIGCQGHATIFRNKPEINAIYRGEGNDGRDYKTIYQTEYVCATDVNFIRNRFDMAGKKQYVDTIYAGLLLMKPGFFLQAMPKELDYQNRRQVFTWDNGHLYRHYIVDGKLLKKEFLYIHFFKRPMKNLITQWDHILIYPDVYRNYTGEISISCVNKYGHKSYFSFIIRMIKQNKHRLTFKNAFLFIYRIFK